MKEQITSALRHALTFLPALGVFFASKGWITPEEGSVLDQELTDTLAVVAGLAGAAISRLLMFLIAKHAPHFSNIFGAGSGGNLPLLAITATSGIILAGASLTSCVVGVDAEGGWSVRPDPRTVDAGFSYLVRHQDDAKSGLKRTNRGDAKAAEVNAEK